MSNNIPLAERLRPSTLDDYFGQTHLVGENGVIRRMIETGRINSFILWGPPGVGKTTLAKIIANSINAPFFTLSAVTSGVKDVRDVIDRCRAESRSVFNTSRPILFIDEIHRFSKSQQDSLLGAVEQGIVTLIGATTENPSFEVIRPLLSRVQVYTLKPFEISEMESLLTKALTSDPILKERVTEIKETEALFRFAGGDARKLLNILDLLEQSTPQGQTVVVNDAQVTEILQENDIRVELDSREEKLGYRMRESQMRKIPVSLVLGNSERDEGTVTLRFYGSEDKKTMPLSEFISYIKEAKEKRTKVLD